MQAIDWFETAFARRLREELDAVRVEAPPLPAPAARLTLMPPFGLLRPVAFALASALALAALATAVTRSPDPSIWVQPAVWMHALGVGPEPATTAPKVDTGVPASPTERAEPRSTAEPGESSPASTVHESPEPHESEGPSSTGGGSPPPHEESDG